MKKKWIAILETVCLLIGLCACSPAGEETNSSKDASLPDQEVSSSQAQNTTPPEAAELAYFPQNTSGDNTLKWVIQDDSGLNMREDIVEAINQILAQKGRGYRLQIITLKSQQGDVAEILEKRLDGDFDLLRVAAVEKNYLPFDTMGALAEKGLLLPLNEYLETSDGQTLRDRIAWEKDWLQGTHGNTIYGVPVNCAYPAIRNCMVSDQVIGEYGFAPEDFQKDFWEQPEVLGKIYQRNGGKPFLAFSFGAQTSRGVTIPSWLPTDPRYSMISSLAAVDRYSEDGEIVNLYETEYFEQCLNALTVFYEKGYLLSQEGMQQPDRQLVTYLTGNVLTETTGAQSEKHIYPIGRAAIPNQFLQPRLANAVSATSQKQKEALDFLTLIHTDEALCQLIAYGIEEKDYIATEGVIEDGEYHPGAYNGAYLVYGEEFTSLTPSSVLYLFPEKEGMTRKESCRSYLEEAALDPYAACPFDFTPVQQEYEAVEKLIHDYAMKISMQIETGQSMEGLQELRKKLEEAGANRVIAELKKQAQYFKQKSE